MAHPFRYLYSRGELPFKSKIMSHYTVLLNYAMSLINDKKQSEAIIKASVEATIDMYLEGKIKPTEGRECLYKSIRDKCFDHLKLKLYQAESL